ncbi:MAG: low molecular weight protein-tyrosine-phosphatase [Longicatena sp.]|nr:low molecular weight protein-tyrosine-phosphatase [Longicatena sp.]
MIKILFICHGNICRSPMAEFVMKDMVEKKGLQDQFHIESAATSREEIGNSVYPPAKRMLAKHGISCEGKRARQVTKADLEHYDYLVLMDRNNMSNMIRMFGAENMNKVSMLLDRDVADPWYTGNFDKTMQDVQVGCTKLLNQILDTHFIK